MNYKDLNVYQRAYKVAIDLHHFIDENSKMGVNHSKELYNSSRDILCNIVEGFRQRTTKAKRFFNFKALDVIRRIQMDLDFLHDIQLISDDDYSLFYNEYDVCAKQLFKLNNSILEREREKQVETMVTAPAVSAA